MDPPELVAAEEDLRVKAIPLPEAGGGGVDATPALILSTTDGRLGSSLPSP